MLRGLICGLFLLWACAAHAQGTTTTPIPPGFLFNQSATTTLSASTISAQASVGSYPMVMVTNTSNAKACIVWGASPVATYPCNQSLAPGQSGIYLTLGAAKVAAILQTGSATLLLYEGYIVP